MTLTKTTITPRERRSQDEQCPTSCQEAQEGSHAGPGRHHPAAKAANLVAIADDLDRQMTRIASHQQFAEKIEARLNTLSTLSAGVDRKLEEQLSGGRRADVESLKSLCDGPLSLQVGDVQQKIGAVARRAAQAPAHHGTGRGAEGTNRQGGSGVQASPAGRDPEFTAQETRLAELLDASRGGWRPEVGERLKQIEGLAVELGRSSVVKDELVRRARALVQESKS